MIIDGFSAERCMKLTVIIYCNGHHYVGIDYASGYFSVVDNRVKNR